MAEIRPYGSPSFDFNFTAKIVQIPISQTEASIQDLWNAIVEAHADIQSMDDDEIASISGKEALGGGQFVGLTLSLINGWRVQAAPRAGPDFVTVQVSGGNLVTAEADQAPGPPAAGAATNPIAPADYVTIIIAQSTSGVISDRQDIDNKYLIESLHAGPKAIGDSYYWDPVNGNDGNNGETPDTARKTFQSIHDDLVTDWNSDVIFAVAGNASGHTFADEGPITWSKNALSLRATPNLFTIRALTDTGPTLSISGHFPALQGVSVRGPATGGYSAVFADNAVGGVHDMFFTDCEFQFASGHGLELLNVEDVHIIGGQADHNTGSGLYFDAARHIHLEDVRSYDNTADGVHFRADPGDSSIHGKAYRCEFVDNGGYGINIASSDVAEIEIFDPMLGDNTSGDIQNLGTNTFVRTTSSDVADIHDEALGRWVIDKETGVMTLYRVDGTVLTTFNLLDNLGAQVTDGANVYERVTP